jgi:hypothetical protein
MMSSERSLTTMKKVAATLLFAALAAMPIVAQRGPRPDGPPPLPEYLQLTPAQQTAWEQAHTEFRAIVEPLHAREREAHDALDAKLQSVLTPDQRAKFEAFQAAEKFLRERQGPPPPR